MTKVLTVHGRAVPVLGDDIDTDRIIPARYLKEITFTNMGAYPFYDERFDAKGGLRPHAFNEPRYKGARILFANVNFGCGSSREHAPQALVRWGIQAIVAESFAEIFAGNCVMLGTPAATATKKDVAEMQMIAKVHPELEWELDLETMTITIPRSQSAAITPELEPHLGQSFKVELQDSRRKALREGTWDSTGLLMANAEKVKALAAKLPYMSGPL